MPGCVPTLTDAPLGDACGVFVDPLNGLDSGAGTITAPQKTLAAALVTWVPGKAIFVCDGALTDTEPLVVPAGVVVYGGLDCAGAYKVKSPTARTALAPKAGAIPLTLSDGAATTELHRLSVPQHRNRLHPRSSLERVHGDDGWWGRAGHLGGRWCTGGLGRRRGHAPDGGAVT